MRFAHPKQTEIDGKRLKAVLRRTETTGSFKLGLEANLYVSTDAWVVCPNWLATGFALYRQVSNSLKTFLPAVDVNLC